MNHRLSVTACALLCTLLHAACTRCEQNEVEEAGSCVRVCNAARECGEAYRCEDGRCRAGVPSGSSSSGAVVTSSSTQVQPSSTSQAGSSSSTSAPSSTSQAGSSSAPSSSGPEATLQLDLVMISSVAGECSGALVLSTAPRLVDTVVSVATAADRAVFLDAGCATPISELTIPATTTNRTFHLRGTVANTAQFTLTSSIGMATVQHTVTPGTPARLRPVANPAEVKVDGCSAAFRFDLADAWDNATTAAADVLMHVEVTADDGAPDVVVSSVMDCSNATGSAAADVLVTAGSAFGTAHLKARRADAVHVTAQLPGGTATMVDTLFWRPVVRGTCTLGMSQSEVVCATFAALPARADRSVLLFQAAPQGTRPDNAAVRCQPEPLTGLATGVRCFHDTASAPDVDIHVQLVEFPRGVRVQHLAATSVEATATIPVSAVIVSHTFLTVSTTGAGTYFGSDDAYAPRLASPTSVVISAVGPGSANKIHAVQVVEMEEGEVSTGTQTLASGALSSTATLPAATITGDAFLLHSVVMPVAVSPPPCSFMLRGLLADATTAVFSRGRGAAGCAESELRVDYQRVTLAPGFTVTPFTLDFTVGQSAATIPGVWDPERTLFLMAGQSLNGQSGGEGSITDLGEGPGSMMVRPLDGVGGLGRNRAATGAATFSGSALTLVF